MKVLHFVCHLGLALAVAGAGDCFARYHRLGKVIEIYESVSEPPQLMKAYAEIMAGHPRSDFAVTIYKSQEERLETQRKGTIELLRAFQDSFRIQGVLFGMLIALFGVATLRLSGSNRALQGDRPPGSGRA